MMHTYRLRELLSMLRVHDPSIYDYLPQSSLETRAAYTLLSQGGQGREYSIELWVPKASRVRSVMLSEEDMMHVSTLYSECAHLRDEMEQSLSEFGSQLTVGHLRYTRDVRSVEEFTVGRKVLRTVGSIPQPDAVERGLCTIRYDDDEGVDGYGYGVIQRMFIHDIYNHPKSPRAIVLDVMPWKVDTGTTSLLRAKKAPVDTPSIWIMHYEVLMSTFLMKPAIESDLGGEYRTRNGHTLYTHNLIFLGGVLGV